MMVIHSVQRSVAARFTRTYFLFPAEVSCTHCVHSCLALGCGYTSVGTSAAREKPPAAMARTVTRRPPPRKVTMRKMVFAI